jgi:DUF1016 N-terminal domain
LQPQFTEILTLIQSVTWSECANFTKPTPPLIASALLTQSSWTRHYTLISRCKTEAERLFYLQLAATERYSTRELDRQINSGN